MKEQITDAYNSIDKSLKYAKKNELVTKATVCFHSHDIWEKANL